MLRRNPCTVVAVAVVCLALLACGLGGPSPTQAFLDYRKAFDKAQSIDELLVFLGAPMRASVESTPKDRRAAQFGFVKLTNDIIDLEVTKETVTGAEATLEATGTSSLGEDVRGTILLIKEDKAWKLKNEKWEGATGGAPPAARDCAQLSADLRGGEAAQARAAARLMGRACTEAIPAIVGALGHGRAGIRANAQTALATSLTALDPGAVAPFKTHLEAILAAKKAAAKADDIGELSLQEALGVFQAEAIPYLVPDLERPTRELRFGAAVELGRLGPLAKDALPALEAAATKETDEVTKEALVRAIARIKGA